MKNLFPNAGKQNSIRLLTITEILKYWEQPPPEIVNGSGQYLQIASVRPSSKEEMEGKQNKNISLGMPPTLQKYYLVNDVNVFVISKPFRKTKEKSDNEFKVNRILK